MKIIKDSFGTVIENINGAVDIKEITAIGWRKLRRKGAFGKQSNSKI